MWSFLSAQNTQLWQIVRFFFWRSNDQIFEMRNVDANIANKRIQFVVSADPDGLLHNAAGQAKAQTRISRKFALCKPFVTARSWQFRCRVVVSPGFVILLQLKVCGSVAILCALVCVIVTVTTTAIHMSRLQNLRECVYTARARYVCIYIYPYCVCTSESIMKQKGSGLNHFTLLKKNFFYSSTFLHYVVKINKKFCAQIFKI